MTKPHVAKPQRFEPTIDCLFENQLKIALRRNNPARKKSMIPNLKNHATSRRMRSVCLSSLNYPEPPMQLAWLGRRF